MADETVSEGLWKTVAKTAPCPALVEDGFSGYERKVCGGPVRLGRDLLADLGQCDKCSRILIWHASKEPRWRQAYSSEMAERGLALAAAEFSRQAIANTIPDHWRVGRAAQVIEEIAQKFEQNIGWHDDECPRAGGEMSGHPWYACNCHVRNMAADIRALVKEIRR